MEPMVAIVGRPNTGKSTFFNKIAGKRISIVDDEPGVTRDRIYADAEWCGRSFTIIDTGGIDLESDDEFAKHILKQAEIAIELSDVILFFVDGKEGLVASDYAVADKLRKSKKRVIVVVNKLDNFELTNLYDFYSLGIGDVMPISAEQGKGLGDLLDEVVKNFPRVEKQKSEAIKIAVVGKPNTGKSSIVNKLLGEERMIVSAISGTTRDAVEIPFNWNKKKYILVDTAGMRRKRSIEDETVERYSIFRTLDAIRRADVVAVIFDVSEEISEQDVRIAGLVHESKKPSIIVLNKWDLIEKETNTMNKFTAKLGVHLAFMSYFRPVYLSALTGNRMEKFMENIDKVCENNMRRIKTGDLNNIIQDAVLTTDTPAKNGKRLKIYYSTQSDVSPPTFVIFVNSTTLVTDNYARFLENYIRKTVDFSGTPIEMIFKNRLSNADLPQ